MRIAPFLHPRLSGRRNEVSIRAIGGVSERTRSVSYLCVAPCIYAFDAYPPVRRHSDMVRMKGHLPRQSSDI